MNGQVERVSGILAAKTRALLMGKRVESKYWPLALETATYILNRTPNESLDGRTPYQVATGAEPDYDRLRVFGCRAYVQIPKSERRGKLHDMAWAGALVGYSTQSPEWTILDLRTGKLRRAYSVTFNEEESGFQPNERTEEESVLE